MAAPTDTTKYLDDGIKVTKTTIEFGPLKIYRVPAIPANSFGRNGDIAIVDDTVIPMREIATDVTPVVNDLCQKVGGVWVCGLGGGGGPGGPGFGAITTDAGTLTATVPGDNAPIVGGPGIGTSVVAGQVVITNTSNIFASVTSPAQPTISATGLTDSLNLVAGTNMTITTNAGTNTVTFDSAGGGGGIPGLSVVNINGIQPTLVLEDTTRAGKRLSVAEQPLMFSENLVASRDFMSIGDASDGDSSYVADLDGTVVFATGHCENTGIATKNFELWINGVYSGIVVGTLGPGANTTFVNNALNTDFIRGDRLQVHAVDGVPGNIQDTVVKLTLKWRG